MGLNFILRLPIMFVFIAAVSEGASTSGKFEPIPSSLRNLNLDKFSGEWFEIASTKNPKQVSSPCYCAKSSFNRMSLDEISVVKSCRKAIPDPDIIQEGRATIIDPNVPGAWVVSFERMHTLNNFFVVAVDVPYQNAVVIDHTRSSIAIYSRKPTMDLFILASIRGQLVTQGYDVSNLSETLQLGCWEDKGSIK
ncbi:MAG: lipocalin family protein [Pseudomonadota bacterium]